MLYQRVGKQHRFLFLATPSSIASVMNSVLQRLKSAIGFFTNGFPHPKASQGQIKQHMSFAYQTCNLPPRMTLLSPPYYLSFLSRSCTLSYQHKLANMRYQCDTEACAPGAAGSQRAC